MKKYILIIIAIIAYSNSVAKNKNKQQLDKVLSTENSLMWQISGNGLQQASYLFGTIHAIPTEDFFMGKNLLKKLKQSSLLVMELDISKVDVAKVAQFSLLPEPNTIKDYLSDNEYELVKNYMINELEVNSSVFEMAYSKLKPFYIEQMMLSKVLGDQVELYEKELYTIAENNNINSVGLETFDEQLAMIDSIPLAIQFSNLVSSIKNENKQEENFKKLVALYKQQDLKQLSSFFEEEFEEEMKVYKTKLLDNRNTTWVPKLENYIKNNACFIAVGAGHLAGNNGIIKLLQQKGYTVVPININ